MLVISVRVELLVNKIYQALKSNQKCINWKINPCPLGGILVEVIRGTNVKTRLEKKRGKREQKRKKEERTSKSQKGKIFAKGPNLRAKCCVRGGDGR